MASMVTADTAAVTQFSSEGDLDGDNDTATLILTWQLAKIALILLGLSKREGKMALEGVYALRLHAWYV